MECPPEPEWDVSVPIIYVYGRPAFWTGEMWGDANHSPTRLQVWNRLQEVRAEIARYRS